MIGIIHFEDYENAAETFREKWLDPKLADRGLLSITRYKWQDYLDEASAACEALDPSEVARQAYLKWINLEVQSGKTVWILDLDETGSNTPDRSYGLCVLDALARNEFHQSTNEFLSKDSFLVVVLTLYPGRFLETSFVKMLPDPCCDLSLLSSLWPSIRKIKNENPNKVELSAIKATTFQIGIPGPRIILAKSRQDEAWLVSLIADWLEYLVD
jgi:hypothetical protein